MQTLLCCHRLFKHVEANWTPKREMGSICLYGFVWDAGCIDFSIKIPRKNATHISSLCRDRGETAISVLSVIIS